MGRVEIPAHFFYESRFWKLRMVRNSILGVWAVPKNYNVVFKRDRIENDPLAVTVSDHMAVRWDCVGVIPILNFGGCSGRTDAKRFLLLAVRVFRIAVERLKAPTPIAKIREMPEFKLLQLATEAAQRNIPIVWNDGRQSTKPANKTRAPKPVVMVESKPVKPAVVKPVVVKPVVRCNDGFDDMRRLWTR